MSDSDLKAIAVALLVYATAFLCMGVALLIGLYAVGAAWALDMPAMYVLQLVAWGIGVAWAGYYYRLASVAAWFTVAGGAGIVVLVLAMAIRGPELLVIAGACGVMALSLLNRLPRHGPRRSPDGTAWLPEDDGPEAAPAADTKAEQTPACHACGAPVEGTVCDECGTPMTPSAENTIIAFALLRPRMAIGAAVGFVLAPVAVVQYVLSPEGQGDAMLVVALIVGPVAIVGLAWYGYRRWYLRRYPDE